MKLFQVDAFSDAPFAGNPAAVCRLDEPREDRWMQDLAVEMNLSETAFVRRQGERYELRWFTPASEVDLCGHATLASAHVLWEQNWADPRLPIEFETRSGILTARRLSLEETTQLLPPAATAAASPSPLIQLDFPATAPLPCSPPPDVHEVLGAEPIWSGESRFDWMFVLDSAETVRRLTPDFKRMTAWNARGVMVTAESDDPRCDVVSRFFAPACLIDEDPVTGSAHCCLGPYWSRKLDRPDLVCYQASRRGGVLYVQPRADRVRLAGYAVTVMEARLFCA